jgi:hypothetical protein
VVQRHLQPTKEAAADLAAPMEQALTQAEAAVFMAAAVVDRWW